ncbi:MAG TPA: NAD(P)H-dependent oxidoreductase subunit E [Acetobacteraceae bacterium]|jgi:formate dehydrogenase subunit gamma|nr:NAD(P)H-dependent oxidoreductase subunit E [Acetobacteraceae bacterium]
MSARPEWDESEAATLIARHSEREGGLLPVLHELQARFGCVPDGAVPLVADALNISRVDVHGVLTFYDDFRRGPPPPRVVRLCRAEACQALGCEDLVAELARRHGVFLDTPTEIVAVETVYCLGNCALGPSALVGDELVGRLDAARLAELCGLPPR